MRELKWSWTYEDGSPAGFKAPSNNEELAAALEAYWGLSFPSVAHCPGHTAPFDVLAEAYFGKHEVTVWVASRGFGGKTTILAGLGLIELLSMLDVSILGGSGEQSSRVHAITKSAWGYTRIVVPCPKCQYINPADEDNCLRCSTNIIEAEQFSQRAPLHLLRGEPLATRTSTLFGNSMIALTASTKAARGPHPQRLRFDEVDEMELEIIDAAMGQTMETDRGRRAQTVFASTHHYPTGAMTEILKRARQRGWPVREWCYKETLYAHDNPGSWLLPENIERKRREVTGKQWRVEYDLEEPGEGGRLFSADALKTLFEEGEEVEDDLNSPMELEEPEDIGEYAHGADWARKQDLSVMCTLRTDCAPATLVYWARYFQQHWPWTIRQFNQLWERYEGQAAHDATGIGDVVDGYLEIDEESCEAVTMTGSKRVDLFIRLEKAVEDGELLLPRLASLISVFKHVTREDLYGGGHPPDEIVAIALAVTAAKLGLGERRQEDGGGMTVRKW